MAPRKTRKPPRPPQPFDEHAATELMLYGENDSSLYRQREEPIRKNLRAKMAKGKYDPAKAEKLWLYWADDAAQRYTKEFGDKRGPHGSFGIFDPATRREVARRMARGFEAEQRAQHGSKSHAGPAHFA